jgi:uncharacterized repeat protein (TIGR01451 family)
LVVHACLLAALVLAPAVALARPVVHLQFAGQLAERLPHGAVRYVALKGKTLHQGDRIRFTIVAANTGSSPALALAPNAPIPKDTMLVAGSARSDAGASVLYSSDRVHWKTKPTVQTAVVRWITKRALRPHAAFHYSYEVIVR